MIEKIILSDFTLSIKLVKITSIKSEFVTLIILFCY